MIFAPKKETYGFEPWKNEFSGGASQAIIKINNRKRNQGSTKQQKNLSQTYLPEKPYTIFK